MYKLSDNIEQKRKILSNFPITREDRNKTLVGSMNSSSGGGADGTFTYKSRKVVWEISQINDTVSIFLAVAANTPLYSVTNRPTNYPNKYYGISSNSGLLQIVNNIESGNDSLPLYIEESEGNYNIKSGSLEFQSNGDLLDGWIKYVLSTTNNNSQMPTREEVIQAFETFGIKQIPYEDYINFNIRTEHGSLTLKN